MKEKIKNFDSKFRIWQDLMDTSLFFALAGIKLKGYPEVESLDKLRDLWIKASREHKQANLNIIKKLYAQRNKSK